MKITFFLMILLLSTSLLKAQSQGNIYENSADKLLATEGNLAIGGYAQVDYNQPLSSEIMKNGTLDVHRLVMLLGYRFNDRTQFISEIEFEHVSEVYVEQAFLQYKINQSIQLQGGLMLIPMGIVNQYHEPTAYNGVERPFIDEIISPTTWREIGVGVTGNLINQSIKYQAYIVNGFNGYTTKGGATFSGEKGLRNGRQKGANSYISSPNFTGRIEYYGLKGLNIGLSGYFGKSQSGLYDGISKDTEDLTAQNALAKADSSTIGISMIGVDARYNISALQLRGQLYTASLSNTDQYNTFTKSAAKSSGVIGSKMVGYYLEAGYNVLKHISKCNTELVPFVRYEKWDTQAEIADGFTKNTAYDKNAITAGLGWKPAPGAVIKADMQWVKSEASDDALRFLNVGIGVMF